jgi:hypothetical protein
MATATLPTKAELDAYIEKYYILTPSGGYDFKPVPQSDKANYQIGQEVTALFTSAANKQTLTSDQNNLKNVLVSEVVSLTDQGKIKYSAVGPDVPFAPVINTTVDLLGSLAQLVSDVMSGNFWVRILEVGAGVALIVMGIRTLGSPDTSPVTIAQQTVQGTAVKVPTVRRSRAKSRLDLSKPVPGQIRRPNAAELKLARETPKTGVPE